MPGFAGEVTCLFFSVCWPRTSHMQSSGCWEGVGGDVDVIREVRGKEGHGEEEEIAKETGKKCSGG